MPSEDFGSGLHRCEECGNDYGVAGPGQADCPYCGHNPYVRADGGETGARSVDDTARSGRIPANPFVPCHECGTEERFMTMKRSDDWTLEYLDDGSGEWVAYCPECGSR